MVEKAKQAAKKSPLADLSGGSKATFNRKEVERLLEQQIADCADAIQGDNLSEYTAKKKILATNKVEF